MRLALLALAVGLPGFSAVIDFDSLLDGTVVTNQFAGVLFSSTAGNVNFVTNQANYNGTKPNFICSGPSGFGGDCLQDTVLDFTTGVSGLTFQGMGVNDVKANVAQVDVFVGGVFSSTITVAGNGESLDPVLVDLSGFSNVTKIRIYSITDSNGIGWDTFSYNDGTSGAVPEPSTFVLMCGGLGMAYLARRRNAA